MRASVSSYAGCFDRREDLESHLTEIEAEKCRPGDPEIRALCSIFNVTLHLFKEVNADPTVFNEQVLVRDMFWYSFARPLMYWEWVW